MRCGRATSTFNDKIGAVHADSYKGLEPPKAPSLFLCLAVPIRPLKHTASCFSPWATTSRLPSLHQAQRAARARIWHVTCFNPASCIHPGIHHADWLIEDWKRAYDEGADPAVLLEQQRAGCAPGDVAWISMATAAQLQAQVQRLKALEQSVGRDQLPLYGIPFAAKDNIDVAGFTTTAACPAFAYEATQDAVAVQRLKRGRRRAGQDQSGPVRHRPGGRADVKG